MAAAVSDEEEEDDDASDVSLTSVLSLLAADGGCVDPDADDVLSIVHDIHHHHHHHHIFYFHLKNQ